MNFNISDDQIKDMLSYILSWIAYKDESEADVLGQIDKKYDKEQAIMAACVLGKISILHSIDRADRGLVQQAIDLKKDLDIEDFEELRELIKTKLLKDYGEGKIKEMTKPNPN